MDNLVPENHIWYFGTMTAEVESPDSVQIKIRVVPELLDEIDKRIALVRTKGKIVSRSQWFENMALWVVHRLPHEAVRADLIEAWPDMPEEALRIDK